VITVTWTAVPTATNYIIMWSQVQPFPTTSSIITVGAVTTYTTPVVSRTGNWYFRMDTINVVGRAGYTAPIAVTPAP